MGAYGRFNCGLTPICRAFAGSIANMFQQIILSKAASKSPFLWFFIRISSSAIPWLASVPCWYVFIRLHGFEGSPYPQSPFTTMVNAMLDCVHMGCPLS